jgi:prophage regulatory protein
MAPAPRHLVGAAEISQMLGGLSRQRVQQIINRRDFPKPYDELAMGKVWRRPAVEAWARARGLGPSPDAASQPDSG